MKKKVSAMTQLSVGSWPTSMRDSFKIFWFIREKTLYGFPKLLILYFEFWRVCFFVCFFFLKKLTQLFLCLLYALLWHADLLFGNLFLSFDLIITALCISLLIMGIWIACINFMNLISIAQLHLNLSERLL